MPAAKGHLEDQEPWKKAVSLLLGLSQSGACFRCFKDNSPRFRAAKYCDIVLVA